MSATAKKRIRVSASEFRDRFKHYAAKAKGGKVVLVENRRQGQDKYLVDKEWFDNFVREHESILATLEILRDRKLTERLLSLARTIDADVDAGRLHSMEEVFGKP